MGPPPQARGFAGVVLLMMAVLALAIGSLLLWREQGRTQEALIQALAHQEAAEQQRARAERGYYSPAGISTAHK